MIKLTNVNEIVRGYVRSPVLETVNGSVWYSVRSSVWDSVEWYEHRYVRFSVNSSLGSSVTNSAWHYIDYDFSPDILYDYFNKCKKDCL